MAETLHLAGLTEVQAAPVLARLLLGRGGAHGGNGGADAGSGPRALIVTAGQGTARSFAKNLSFFLKRDVLALPEDDPPFLRYEARSRETEAARRAAMDALLFEDAAVVVCPVSALIKRTLCPDAFSALTLTIRQGETADPEELNRRLFAAGYQRTPYTENPGEFSRRGGILDVFPIGADAPCRVEFFDTEIERIRRFDPDTQTSTGAADFVRIPPAGGGHDGEGFERAEGGGEYGADAEYGGGFARGAEYGGGAGGDEDEDCCLADWIGAADFFAVVDPGRVEQSLALRETEAAADFAALLENGEASAGDWARFVPAEGYFDILARRAACIVTPYGDLPEASADAARRGQDRGQGGLRGGLRTVSYEAKYPAAFFGQMDLLSAELKRYLRLRFEITIVCSTRERLDHLRAFAEEEGFGGRIAFAEGELTAGCEITSEKLVWLWDGDIFKSEKKSRRRGLRSREKIAAFADIQAGDYVVHEKHGIGVYGGIKTIEVGGVSRDYLSIAYAGKDVLYVPAEQMDVVQRYIGGGESRPKVSKLGSDEWTRTKTRVRAEVEVYAAELLKLAAERKLAPGHAFSPDTVWQKDFEDRFPWEPTSDQIRCFDAVRTDMENPWPMDRLICGDVGYGKTEVALRAVFKCVSDSKQAAVLVPTTILASQHYRTFSERFGDFPVRTEMLSRFQTPAKQKEILKGLADGSVDIVIGTHALLGANVAFKGLGLLVIDEEQRFGVRHKERVRALRVGVDVLTLTATPIPRTLNMSLLGIKDMELIEEPPEDRHPVRTYVSEQRDDVIAESIRRELDRGGQVYVVFNRVSGIERAGEYIAALTPGARVGVCHAQMNERVIEEIMMDFCEGDYDILVSTTIIESGLDIPNVNTILILDADRLGLTQLYQLRGRVGRRDRIAFAYLLYRRDKVLTETAQKRLRTIREFTEFGSGFKIAMKDLEIRGAGNLLGVSQHGHMTAVGYELYCKLMDDAVSALTGGGGAGRAMAPEEECHLDLDVSAVVPSKYIEDEVVKLQVYKRISTAAGEEDAEALLAELDDRFGSVPPSVKNLAYIAVIKHLSDRIGLAEVSLKGNRAVFTYREAPEGFPEKVFRAADAAAGRLTADIKSAPRLRQTLTAAEGAAKLAEMLAVLRALLP